MTIKEFISKEKIWWRKVLAVETFHNMKVIRNNNHWTIRNTANELKLSVGLISEDLNLAKWIRKQEKITISRNKALCELKKSQLK